MQTGKRQQRQAMGRLGFPADPENIAILLQFRLE
jgi:hypothetical protein